MPMIKIPSQIHQRSSNLVLLQKSSPDKQSGRMSFYDKHLSCLKRCIIMHIQSDSVEPAASDVKEETLAKSSSG
jgi:hypothetical protein